MIKELTGYKFLKCANAAKGDDGIVLLVVGEATKLMREERTHPLYYDAEKSGEWSAQREEWRI